jgi:hypothetical protein
MSLITNDKLLDASKEDLAQLVIELRQMVNGVEKATKDGGFHKTYNKSLVDHVKDVVALAREMVDARAA